MIIFTERAASKRKKYNFFKYCEDCGERFNPTGKQSIYCFECYKKRIQIRRKVKIHTHTKEEQYNTHANIIRTRIPIA